MASRKPGKTSAVLALAALIGVDYVYATAEAAAPLIAAGHAEQNTEMVNADNGNEFATRITEAGKAAYEAAKATPATPPAPKAAFVISKGVEKPAVVRTSHGRESIYPWGVLEVGDSFFVPGKVASKFGSTISTARKSFKEKGDERKFSARNVTEDGVTGIRVWRDE